MQALEDILTADLRDSYGLNCSRLEPVAGGWLNKKWQTIAGGERLLIKQFSRERFQPLSHRRPPGSVRLVGSFSCPQGQYS